MFRIPALMLAMIYALPAAAADKFDAEARARAVAPFIEEQTVAVVHVDLSRIDADALLNRAAEVGRLEKKDIEGLQREFRGWLTDLTKAGGNEVYIVVNLTDLLREPPLMMVPLAAGADAQAVRRMLESVKVLEQFHFETRGQTLLGGSEGARQRLRNAKPVNRPELARAFAAAGDTTAQLLLLPTPETRRVIDELLPQLPPQVGGGSTRPLTHCLHWAAVGMDLPPKLSLRLVMQSPDADATGKLKALLTQLLKVVANQGEARAFMPVIDRLVEALTPQTEGDRLTVSLGDKELNAYLVAPVRSFYQARERRIAEANLRRMTIAMHSYADAHKGRNAGRLPATANYDKQGKPLLSWRVHLLPFVGGNDLYRQFHLDEPWDSPHNRKLLPHMPEVYQGPNRKLNEQGKTIYLLPVGKDVAFKVGSEGPRLPTDFPDGASNTIAIVESDDAHAVPWTKPEDLKIDLDHPERGLGGHFQGVFVVGMADGSVRLLASGINKLTLRTAFTPAGGDVFGSDW